MDVGSSVRQLVEQTRSLLHGVLQRLEGERGQVRGDSRRAGAARGQRRRIALNAALGNVGKTVVYTETVNPMPREQVADLKSLVGDMNAGKVQWLVMLGVNPLYSAPADLEFEAAFNKVRTRCISARMWTRRARYSVWHINKAHYLESWSDARAYDGTISIIQPMIAPLYGGHRRTRCCRRCWTIRRCRPTTRCRRTRRLTIKGRFRDGAGARRCTMDGSTARRLRRRPWRSRRRSGCAASRLRAAMRSKIAFLPDPSLYDGRYANVGWLQELPKQITNLSWDNAALMSCATMEKPEARAK